MCRREVLKEIVGVARLAWPEREQQKVAELVVAVLGPLKLQEHVE